MTIFRVPVAITYPGSGGPGRNVFHVRTIGPNQDDSEQLGEALDALQTFYETIKQYYPSGTTIRMGEGMIRDPLGNPEYEEDNVKTVVSGGSGGHLSPLLCACVSWRTTSASRSGRGRTFIGPFNVQAQDSDGTITASYLNLLRNAAATLVSASTGPSGWSLGVLSVKQGLLRDFTGSSVKDQFAYLSSRRD